MAKLPQGVILSGKNQPGYGRLLTSQALTFVAQLHRVFEAERQRLLAARVERQKLFDKGALPDFAEGTAAIRAGTWKAAAVPQGLQDRRVEIISSVDRKSAIEAFNSGAKVYVADFEDSTSPTWANMVQGHINLMDRWTGKMEWTEPGSDRRYGLAGKPAVLMVKPRGLHLDEPHMKVDGRKVAAALFDFGLYFFHNARTAITKTSGPYFYLAKLENHLEARLWNQIFVLAQSLFGLKLGTIKAAVMIETVPACFEMDEIIFELRDHMAGLSCGHAGLVFSFIKTFSTRKSQLLPECSQIGASQAFLAAYSALLVKTCHRRGCFAVGDSTLLGQSNNGMEHEARQGFDGTRVAHPGLVSPTMETFNELMPTLNNLYVARDDVKIGQKNLLETPEGTRTEQGFRENIRVCIRYMEAWLGGLGTVAMGGSVEDSATMEIRRAQLWQWRKLGLTLAGGRKITAKFFDSCLTQEMSRLKEEAAAGTWANGRFREAAFLLKALTASRTIEPFFTVTAFRNLR